MPMTKAERAEMTRLRTAAALCWPTFARPAPMTAEEIAAAPTETLTPRDQSDYKPSQVVVAWFPNAHTRRVTKGWVTPNSKYCDHDDAGLTRAGGSRYERANAHRSELDAWQALRWMVADQCADQLEGVDDQLYILGLRDSS